MAIKHFNEYYERVCADYKEAIQDLKDLQEECTKNLVEPERVDNLRVTLSPLLKNYQQVSFFKYLLEMPEEEEAEKTYAEEHKEELNKIADENKTAALLLENKEVLSRLKEFKINVN